MSEGVWPDHQPGERGRGGEGGGGGGEGRGERGTSCV